MLRSAVTIVLGLAAWLVLAVPGEAQAEEEIPVCHPVMSSTLCYYAYDPNDCWIDQESQIRYCRTIGVFRWEVN